MLRLRLAQLARQRVERCPDRHRAGVEVDVGPAKRKQLSLAGPDAEGRQEERLDGYGVTGPYQLLTSNGGAYVPLDKPGPPW